MGFPKEIKKHLRFVSPVILATSTCNNELNLNARTTEAALSSRVLFVSQKKPCTLGKLPQGIF